jgi:UDP-N-acetylglucosamine/UDP-N-acetylgalactosamine diphosphorylase
VRRSAGGILGAVSLPSTVAALIDRGVRMPLPETVHIADDVDPARISGDGVTIHPGCRVSGGETVVSSGVTLGAEGPVTIRDVRLGPGASIAAGYAAKAVLLEGASLGSGAHVREGTLLEEQASTAHTVGLKQTILLPYVTLGSLINFCDCLMSGGTSRRDHSEVGSSYIHFNFTPDGDKTTPSLFGDVVHGVLLDRPAIFLGGQGGAVGPVAVGFGSVVAAGSIVRSDVPPGKLVVVAPPPALTLAREPADYRAVNRLLARNLRYLGELAALQAWHRWARAPFFAAQPLGPAVGAGALAMLDLARAERISRLRAMLAKAPGDNAHAATAREHLDEVCRVVASAVGAPPAGVLDPLVAKAEDTAYLEAVHSLDAAARAGVVEWLGGSLDAAWAQVGQLLPAVARLPRAALV